MGQAPCLGYIRKKHQIQDQTESRAKTQEEIFQDRVELKTKEQLAKHGFKETIVILLTSKTQLNMEYDPTQEITLKLQDSTLQMTKTIFVSLNFSIIYFQECISIYGVTSDQILTIWKRYIKIDKKKLHLTPNDILYFLEERDYSIVAQSFYRFFEVIDKVDYDKCTFAEFLPALISFALFTRSEILGFVFSMIDEDKDELVSKADIFKQLLLQRGGYRLYPPNLTRSLEIAYLNRSDQITILQFAEIVQKIPFLIFPAVRLQETLRYKFGGTSMWQKLIKNLNRCNEMRSKQKQSEIFMQSKDKLRMQELKYKNEQFITRRHEWWTEYNKTQNTLRNPMRQVRVARRRASEGMIGVNMEVLFDTRVKDIDYLTQKKQEQLKLRVARDYPIQRERVDTSMVWDKYNFNDGDDVEYDRKLNISDNGETIETEQAKRRIEFQQKKKLNGLKDQSDEKSKNIGASSCLEIFSVCRNRLRISVKPMEPQTTSLELDYVIIEDGKDMEILSEVTSKIDGNLTTYNTRRMDETHITTEFASLFKPQMTMMQTERDSITESNSFVNKTDLFKKDGDLLHRVYSIKDAPVPEMLEIHQELQKIRTQKSKNNKQEFLGQIEERFTDESNSLINQDSKLVQPIKTQQVVKKSHKHSDSSYRFSDSGQEEVKKYKKRSKKKKKAGRLNSKGKIVLNSLVISEEDLSGSDQIKIMLPLQLKSPLQSIAGIKLSDESVDRHQLHQSEIQDMPMVRNSRIIDHSLNEISILSNSEIHTKPK